MIITQPTFLNEESIKHLDEKSIEKLNVKPKTIDTSIEQKKLDNKQKAVKKGLYDKFLEKALLSFTTYQKQQNNLQFDIDLDSQNKLIPNMELKLQN